LSAAATLAALAGGMRDDPVAGEVQSVLDDAEELVPGCRTEVDVFRRHLQAAARSLA
jgi:hypothetical protein